MADNSVRTPGTGENVAADEVTYSGDTSKIQIVRLVTAVTGSEGAKSIVDAAALADNLANPTVILVGSFPHWFDGSVWDRATGDAVNGLLVNLGANNDVTIDAAAVASLALLDDSIFADDAAFTIGTSKVNMAGAVAVAHGANPDAADALDAVTLITNRHRIPFVMGGHPNIVTSRTSYSAAAQTDVAIGPGTIGTGTKIVVTQIQVTVSNPTTATPAVRIGFGATNTPTGTGVVLSHPGLAGGGGISRGDGSGILGIGGDGEELRITADAATGGVLDVVVSYYTIES